ncbi:MAG: Crp/Fnr family transcriptional regulator [Chloroflexi bacterium]|nr:Crp/Fnr family transcriptional regulator [Chloroflexota bacterium]
MDTTTSNDDVKLRVLLRQTDLFSSLSEEALGVIVSTMQKQTLAKDAFLFEKGSEGQHLYIVMVGAVRVCSHSDSGRELSITAYGPGQCIGELSLLDSLPRSASVVAQVDSVLYTLHRHDFDRVLDAHPDVMRQLLAVLSKRLRHTAGVAEQLAFQDVATRVTVALQQRIAEFGTEEHERNVLLNISQKELATYVSASRRSVNHALGILASEGLIELQYKGICIIDAEGLRRRIVA